jgi:hypothetical protein
LPFGIYAAHPNQKKRVKNQGLTMLYSLVPSGKVKPQLHIDKTVTTVVNSRYERVFTLSLDDAIKNAR